MAIGIEVRDIQFGADSKVSRLDAIFEQHCNKSSSTLRGEIRYTAGAN